jgi:hypothetical protein
LIRASLEDILQKEILELSDYEAAAVLNKMKHIIKSDNRFKKGQRIDIQDLEGEMPGIVSSYPGQAGTKKKKSYIHPALIGTKD